MQFNGSCDTSIMVKREGGGFKTCGQRNRGFRKVAGTYLSDGPASLWRERRVCECRQQVLQYGFLFLVLGRDAQPLGCSSSNGRATPQPAELLGSIMCILLCIRNVLLKSGNRLGVPSSLLFFMLPLNGRQTFSTSRELLSTLSLARLNLFKRFLEPCQGVSRRLFVLD